MFKHPLTNSLYSITPFLLKSKLLNKSFKSSSLNLEFIFNIKLKNCSFVRTPLLSISNSSNICCILYLYTFNGPNLYKNLEIALSNNLDFLI